VLQVAIGLSGGPDSNALLHYLLKFGFMGGAEFKITALHYNHNWNPELDNADQELCESICRAAGVDIITEKNDSGLTSETDSRNLRYDFFKRKCAALDAKILFLGHHQDDNIETIIFRLLRGTGLGGLKGIPLMRELYEGCQIHRPLLGYPKSEIYEYCREYNIPFREDPTNYEVKAKRNQIRHNIVPILEEYEPEFRKYISRMASNVASDAQVLKIWAKEKLKTISKTLGENAWSIDLEQWNRLEECEQILLWRMLDNTSADRHRYEVVKESMVNKTKRNLKGGWVIDYPGYETLRMKRI
jgi:tRNA(Ile)-lysidine synthase